MKITLTAWAKRNFDPPPSAHTLRLIVKAGMIDPPPVRVGRSIMVEDYAVLVAAPVVDIPAWASERVADILRAA